MKTWWSNPPAWWRRLLEIHDEWVRDPRWIGWHWEIEREGIRNLQAAVSIAPSRYLDLET